MLDTLNIMNNFYQKADWFNISVNVKLIDLSSQINFQWKILQQFLFYLNF